VVSQRFTLEEVKVAGVRLDDQVLDGNQAFLRAMGLEPEA